MKKQISILALTARSSLLFALAILLLMAAAQGVLFHLALRTALAELAQRWADYQVHVEELTARGITSISAFSDQLPTLPQLLDKSGILWAWRAALVLLTVQLCRVGCESGAKQGYTLRRLPLSERAVFLWQWVGNALFYLLLWGAQLAVVLVLSRVYLAAAGAQPAQLVQPAGGQTLLLAFYQSSFLHGLLPLDDLLSHAAGLLLTAALAFGAAAFPFWQRRGSFGGEALAALVFALYAFPRDLDGSSAAFTILVSVMILLCAVLRVLRWEEVDGDDSDREPAQT